MSEIKFYYYYNDRVVRRDLQSYSQEPARVASTGDLPFAFVVHVDEATAIRTKHHRLVLKITFPALVADRAVKGVVH